MFRMGLASEKWCGLVLVAEKGVDLISERKKKLEIVSRPNKSIDRLDEKVKSRKGARFTIRRSARNGSG